MRRNSLILAAIAAVTAPVLVPLALAPPALASDSVVVQDLNNGATTADLVQSLLGAGVVASNVSFLGDTRAAGRFTGGSHSVGASSGIVLGSGRVQTTSALDPCAKGVEGPNECTGNTAQLGVAGDSDLTTLAGVSTFDASVLEFDFIPEFASISFQYVFSSDEYLEYANTQYNDTFGFFVNGVNCATVPGTSAPVSINTINHTQNPQLFRDNTTAPYPVNSEMDGLTTVLTCAATVNAGVPNHMKLAIADGSDDVLDSAVFLAGGSFVSGTQVTDTLSGAGLTADDITVPTGTPVTSQAALNGAQANNATGTVSYAIYSDSACTSLLQNAGTKAVTAGSVPASDAITLAAAGTYYWSAAYSGDANNNASEVCDSVETVTAPAVHATATTYNGALAGTYSDPIVLGGNLVDTTAGTPLAGKTLDLSVGTSAAQATTAGPTDSSGNASVTLAQLFQDAGNVPVSVSFAGDATHTASVGSATIVVSPDQCTLTYTGDILVPALTNTILKARLADPDTTPGDLAGHTVTFTVADSAQPAGITTYTDVTDATGLAEFSVPLNADVYSVTAAFAGDSKYAACSTATDTLVTVAAAGNKVTGGGWSSINSGRFNFGFNLIPQTDGTYKGQLQTRSNSNKNNFHGRVVTSASQLANNKVTWSGTGTYNGQPATFTVTVTDVGSGRKGTDSINLVIKDASGTVVLTTGGTVALKGGNITVH